MKIAVYAISLNEQNHVERFCSSCSEADYVIIADTGSTDNTVELAKQHGATVYQIKVSPWRFDHARNSALSLVPDDVDVCISLDLDEVLVPGWRSIIEEHFDGSVTRLMYNYEWEKNYIFQTDKIHSRFGYYWKFACHETLTPDVRITQSYAYTNDLVIQHLADGSKPRLQYLDLLKVDYLENPNDPRSLLYYGRELSFHQHHSDAIAVLTQFNNIKDICLFEKSYANRIIAKCHKRLGNSNNQLNTLIYASQFEPSRETWVALAEYYYENSDWQNCLDSVERALLITHKPTYYTQDPKAWGSLPYDIGSIAAWNLNLKNKAAEYATQALEKNPNDLRIKNNLLLMSEKI
jgi:glycosyltransferase involved in cell wall biosynthesis